MASADLMIQAIPRDQLMIGEKYLIASIGPTSAWLRHKESLVGSEVTLRGRATHALIVSFTDDSLNRVFGVPSSGSARNIELGRKDYLPPQPPPTPDEAWVGFLDGEEDPDYDTNSRFKLCFLAGYQAAKEAR